MDKTLLIILAAVVALIVIVVLTGLRYLRADDDDDFDDDDETPADRGHSRGRGDHLPHERGRSRQQDEDGMADRGRPRAAGGVGRGGDRSRRDEDGQESRGRVPVPQRERSDRRPVRNRDRDDRDRDDLAEPMPAGARASRGAAGRGDRRGMDNQDQRPGRSSAAREFKRDGLDARDGRSAGAARDTVAVRDDRERRASTGPNARPDDARNGSGPAKRDLPEVRPRQGRGKRDDDGDWPSTEWDELSDVDYWAELASDKPLTTTTAQPAAPAAQPARTGRRDGRPDSGPVAARSDSRAADARAADGRAADARASGSRSGELGRQDGDRRDSASRDGGSRSGELDRRDGDRRDSGGFSRDVLAGRERRTDSGVRAVRPADQTVARAIPGGRSSSQEDLRAAMPADDDPLTSPSFPRIAADDSRSYRRSRSDTPSGGYRLEPDPVARSQQPAESQARTQQYSRYDAGSQGQDAQDYDSDAHRSLLPPVSYSQSGGRGAEYAAPAVSDPYRSVPRENSAPHGYPIPVAVGAAGYQAPANSNSYSPPASNGYSVPASSSGYSAPANSGGYSVPAGSGSYSAPAPGSHQVQPPSGIGGYLGDAVTAAYPVPQPGSGGYPAPMSGSAGSPSAGYPAPITGSYPTAGTSGYQSPSGTSSYQVPPGGAGGYPAGHLPAEQQAGYQSYGPSAPASPNSGPHALPSDIVYPPAGFQASPSGVGYPAAGPGQPVPGLVSQPSGYQVPGAQLPSPANAPSGMPLHGGQVPGGGYGGVATGPQQSPSAYPGVQYHAAPYAAPAYPDAGQQGNGYGAADPADPADPYAVDPYGYSGYGSGY